MPGGENGRRPPVLPVTCRAQTGERAWRNEQKVKEGREESTVAIKLRAVIIKT
jgi:hypothetical protein